MSHSMQHRLELILIQHLIQLVDQKMAHASNYVMSNALWSP